MKLQGKITILIGAEGATIEITDTNAIIKFLTVKLTPEQLSTALGRQARVDCGLEVTSLELVGKKHEIDYFEFEIPSNLRSSSKSKELCAIAKPQLSDCWKVDSYFGSKDSFLQKDGKTYARATIRRWI